MKKYLLQLVSRYNDFLVCGISTQLHQLIPGFDELIDKDDSYFAQTGLHQSSLIRLSYLAVIPNRTIAGRIGRIDVALHRNLLDRNGEVSFVMIAIVVLFQINSFSLFTTKLIGQATGLSLLLSYHITIKAESEEGRTSTITLPSSYSVVKKWAKPNFAPSR